MACCCASLVSVCTDCCQNLLNQLKSISLAVDLSFSSTCSGTTYSASLNQTLTASNFQGCPFNPVLCSNCVFYALLEPASGPVCSFQAVLQISVQSGQCLATLSITTAMRAASFALCSSSNNICSGSPSQGFFFSASSAKTFSSPSGCMSGVEFPFDTSATSTPVNSVSISGTVTVVENPLP